jgi:hypothetical protein
MKSSDVRSAKLAAALGAVVAIAWVVAGNMKPAFPEPRDNTYLATEPAEIKIDTSPRPLPIPVFQPFRIQARATKPRSRGA